MAVVGGGVIGIEYASMFAALGVQVTVVDKRPRPLEFIDQEIVDELIHQLRKSDVTFRSGDAVASKWPGPRSQGPGALESGKHVVADLVLFSVGRIGATDSPEPGRGGPAPTTGPVKVDAATERRCPHLRRGGRHRLSALAATSSEQGRLRRATCSAPRPSHGGDLPVGVFAIPEISMVGANRGGVDAAEGSVRDGIARFREIARGQILGDDSGMFKMLFHREDRRLLGCHCIGTGATELIHVGQAVLGLGGGLDYFLNTVFNYPTLAECYKVAAYNAANKLTLLQAGHGGGEVRSRG